MLYNEINFSIKDFQQMFHKKFTNFCKKAPILMSFHVNGDIVRIYEYFEQKDSQVLFDYEFDYHKDVKENIRRIKDRLVHDHYPIMVETTLRKSAYSPQELNQMVSEGEISLDDVDKAEKIEIVDTTIWRIERVIILRDELFVRNLSTNRIYRYRMKTPVTMFLKQCRNNFTKEEAWEYFNDKNMLLNEVEENFPPQHDTTVIGFNR